MWVLGLKFGYLGLVESIGKMSFWVQYFIAFGCFHSENLVISGTEKGTPIAFVKTLVSSCHLLASVVWMSRKKTFVIIRIIVWGFKSLTDCLKQPRVHSKTWWNVESSHTSLLPPCMASPRAAPPTHPDGAFAIICYHQWPKAPVHTRTYSWSCSSSVFGQT